jgi:hypothetical protein
VAVTAAETLLARLDDVGVEAFVVEGRLALVPRERVPLDLVDELRAHRDELLALVEAEERDARDVTFEWLSPTSCIITIRLDERGPLDAFTEAVVQLFDGEVVPESEWAETALFLEPAEDRGRCGGCRGRAWWRLRSGGPAVCSRCHPSPYGDERIERWEVAS